MNNTSNRVARCGSCFADNLFSGPALLVKKTQMVVELADTESRHRVAANDKPSGDTTAWSRMSVMRSSSPAHLGKISSSFTAELPESYPCQGGSGARYFIDNE